METDLQLNNSLVIARLEHLPAESVAKIQLTVAAMIHADDAPTRKLHASNHSPLPALLKIYLQIPANNHDAESAVRHKNPPCYSTNSKRRCLFRRCAPTVDYQRQADDLKGLGAGQGGRCNAGRNGQEMPLFDWPAAQEREILNTGNTHITESAEEKTERLTPVERIQIISAFWAASDDSKFPADLAAIVMNTTISSLSTMRSRGVGPEFMSASGGKRILYTKPAIRAWIESRMVVASNCTQAKALELRLQDAA